MSNARLRMAKYYLQYARQHKDDWQALDGAQFEQIHLLCQRQQDGHTIVPKYIASTATVRQAEPQVQAIFDRRLAQFPPWAISADDRFFARDQEHSSQGAAAARHSHPEQPPTQLTRPGRWRCARQAT